MALNPIVFTEKVVRSFLRYQLTAYAFADEGLHAQMRRLLSLDETRHSPLMRGPYLSLSRPFREGVRVDDLIAEGVFHPHMRQRIPADITHVYGHQEDAIRAIHAKIRASQARPGFIEKGVLAVLKNMDAQVPPTELYRIAQAITQVKPGKISTCVILGSIGNVGGASVVFPNRSQAHRYGNDARKDARIRHC